MHEGLVDEEVVLWVEEGEIWDPEVVATVEVVVDPSPPTVVMAPQPELIIAYLLRTFRAESAGRI
jgi:hypothetical protein